MRKIQMVQYDHNRKLIAKIPARLSKYKDDLAENEKALKNLKPDDKIKGDEDRASAFEAKKLELETLVAGSKLALASANRAANETMQRIAAGRSDAVAFAGAV